MKGPVAYPSHLAESFGEGWNRFWFTPSDALPCSVLRIAVGLIAVAHFAALSIDLERWYGGAGLVPPASLAQIIGTEDGGPNYHYSYLNVIRRPTELWIAHIAALAVAAAFTAGLLTRVTGLLTFVAVLAYVHRLPLISGHLEPVLGFLLLYLCVGPAGRYLSVDRLLRRGPSQPESDPAEPSEWATVSLRLIQVHLAMFYVMMGLSKLNGPGWWDGDAIWSLAAQTESRPLDLTFLRGAEYLVNFWTHAVVYFELAFPILIWNHLARPLLLTISIVIWLSLILVTGHLLFGLAMIFAGAAFMPAEVYRAWFSLPTAKGSLGHE